MKKYELYIYVDNGKTSILYDIYDTKIEAEEQGYRLAEEHNFTFGVVEKDIEDK